MSARRGLVLLVVAGKKQIIAGVAQITGARIDLGYERGYPVTVNDVNNDGVVNIFDLAFVTQHLPAGTVCH